MEPERKIVLLLVATIVCLIGFAVSVLLLAPVGMVVWDDALVALAVALVLALGINPIARFVERNKKWQE